MTMSCVYMFNCLHLKIVHINGTVIFVVGLFSFFSVCILSFYD